MQKSKLLNINIFRDVAFKKHIHLVSVQISIYCVFQEKKKN